MPLDCLVCGSCVVDMLCTPVRLDEPIGGGVLHQIDPILITGGGIVSNSGVTLARLGLKVGAFTYVGRDDWAPIVRRLYQREGIDTTHLMEHPTAATSTTVVAIDPSGGGERSFLHCVGAPKLLDKRAFLDRLDIFRDTRMMLLGYYSLLPNLEADLPEVLAAIRQTGCRTALDAAGSGGKLQPLDRILPHLDVYVPSLSEATNQTGEDDPRTIIDTFRGCGAPGILGVKLGKRGVMLSPRKGEYLSLPIAQPPGPVVDTTGAGDSFYAGLLAGLLKGLSVEDAGKLGAAAGACCVTAMGGSAGGRTYEETARIAGIT